MESMGTVRRGGPAAVSRGGRAAAGGLTAGGAVVAVAAGLLAAATTQALLALTGAVDYQGPPVGLLAVPLLLALARPGIRRQVASGAGLLVLGGAWTMAPIVDHHLTHAVLVDGGLADAIHHGAGWLALAAGWLRIERSAAR